MSWGQICGSYVPPSKRKDAALKKTFGNGKPMENDRKTFD